MTSRTPWKRNTDGLHANAQEKAAQTKQRAEAALALLLREHRLINFKSVAETAGISTAWLYANEDMKQRILHLRAQQAPKERGLLPPKVLASDASKDTVIAALRKRVKDQEAELRELRKQVQLAYGLIAQQS
jgi:predicted DNA-binding transcriptional regulator AlpA